jgi:aldose 1-epimerase
MPLLTIRDATGAQARIHSDLAFNCFDYTTLVGGRRIAVLDYDPGFPTGEAKPRHGGIPLLFPFVNRIKAGRYEWAGTTYDLPKADQFGNAIHGFVSDKPWRVVAQSPESVTGEFQLSLDAPDLKSLWPADFRIRVSYQLEEGCLKSQIVISNPDKVPLPWSFGTHPYFKVPLGTAATGANCLVQVPARSYWELVDCIPTGKILPVDAARDLRDAPSLAALKLDDILTDVTVEQGCVTTRVVDEEAGVQILQVCDDAFREMVVYTPPSGKSVCIEPYTCPTDAINLEARGVNCGWQVLAPGAQAQLWIDIRATEIMA